MTHKVATGFDRLAPVYKVLARIIFGKTLQHAQEYLLTSVKSGDHILILGGGSGEVLKSLLSQQPHVAVDYIDISAKMIQLARKQTKSASNVNFIIGTEQNIPGRTYTIVITNFYLDLFSDSTLPHVIQKIKPHLTPALAGWLPTPNGWLLILFLTKAGIKSCCGLCTGFSGVPQVLKRADYHIGRSLLNRLDLQNLIQKSSIEAL
jgi:SAM-dependent methyltransferase